MPVIGIGDKTGRRERLEGDAQIRGGGSHRYFEATSLPGPERLHLGWRQALELSVGTQEKALGTLERH
jgi:hypothetical protein